MKKSFQIGGAFVGLVVGGGFASGQEIMQFFTGFGTYGITGAIVAMIGFSFLGMSIAQLGYELHTTSHKEVVYHIAGRSFGAILDILITFFLFAVTVAMFAGAGATFYQILGMDPIIGSLFMVIITVLTLMLNVKNIISIIAVATPYLLGVMLIIAIYSIFTMDLTIAEQNMLAQHQRVAAPNWLMGALLYVSYNIATGVAMMTVIGSTASSRKVAGAGGLIGGIILGILILLINIAMFAKMDIVAGKDMPILEIASNMHPLLGIIMAIALLGMIYSTAVGLLYSFIIRFVPAKDPTYKPAVIMVGAIGFMASFIGFTTLVGKVYSLMGYLGFFIIIAIFFSWITKR
ncbi:YkvI family membrane protein [Ureibacillus sinduriensis]|uniref:Membrane protein n=1 Tax=Ureibacillus sinduriensis BLB-1 = JCM 15800 TaxID=1384057 RepID=A0A0A3HXK9_9BACL|nr:membrane protein [Ureibacillus sinduriensis]KGR77321.1 membrane protein [Ureibacillus sinduriensis BLB-1 = JCM 15800]